MQRACKAIGALTVAGALSVGPALFAAEFSNQTSEKQEGQLGVPQTPAEHLARATYYREKAASYRQVAEMHRQMFADYDKKHGSPGAKALTAQDASVAKMRKHCDEYIKEAERFAAQAERFAELHRMLGEEVKKK